MLGKYEVNQKPWLYHMAHYRPLLMCLSRTISLYLNLNLKFFFSLFKWHIWHCGAVTIWGLSHFLTGYTEGHSDPCHTMPKCCGPHTHESQIRHLVLMQRIRFIHDNACFHWTRMCWGSFMYWRLSKSKKKKKAKKTQKNENEVIIINIIN